MSTSNQLITAQELKGYLNITPDITSHDEFLAFLISAASDEIEAYCNTRIKKCTVTEVVSGCGSPLLFMANDHITQIHSVEIMHNGEFIQLIAPELIEEHLSEQGHIIFAHDLVFRSGTFNYRISYECGYDPVPDSIRLLCLELCAISFQNSFRGEGRIGLMSNQEGRYKMFIYNELEKHKHLLEKYRRIII